MSGHSKFSNIKHKKEKNDAAKGKIFTIIGREIAVAVKEGGADPENNSKLRDVIAKAKTNNMPNDTIDRGIKKAAGDANAVNYENITYEGYGPSGIAIIVKTLTDNRNRTAANVRSAFTKGKGNVGRGIKKAAGDANAVNYENITYEGYGPSGIAIIVKTLTDNRNRTAANVRSAFTKGKGNVGTTGCVSYMFDEKGQILVSKEDCDTDSESLMMLAVDAGAEDFNEDEDGYEILTSPSDFSKVREALEKENIKMEDADIKMIPQNYISLSSEDDIKNLQRTLDLLDADDDVQNVYHNCENIEE